MNQLDDHLLLVVDVSDIVSDLADWIRRVFWENLVHHIFIFLRVVDLNSDSLVRCFLEIKRLPFEEHVTVHGSAIAYGFIWMVLIVPLVVKELLYLFSDIWDPCSSSNHHDIVYLVWF